VVLFFLFFSFFELVLIPILYIILGWGFQVERVQAVFYLFIYILLFGFIGLRGFLVFLRKFFSFFEEVFYLIGGAVAMVGLLPFLVKLPVFFFHF